MNYKEKFADIRPFEPEELPQVYDRLMQQPQFVQVLRYLYPDTEPGDILQRMHTCRTSLDFQLTICYDFIKQLVEKASTGLDMDSHNVDPTKRYTFVSNHRDIVLDSALLDKLLVDAGFNTTCEIAIGDNLLTLPWVKDLVRINKSFIVRRGLSLRETLMASKLMAEYMHYVINCKHDNIWIAQREGRAKDSDDRTQSAILKMMTMGGQGSVAQRLQALHIVPLSISYEYDPCDFLKAREFQLKRDNPQWKKSAQDDINSMRTGIMGWKGRIHYHCAPCIDDYLAELPADIAKTEVHDVIAAHIDEQIHSCYRLYPNNYIAWDLLCGTDEHSDRYSREDVSRFEQYIAAQLLKIDDIADKDEPYLRERMLTMYANPAINKHRAQHEPSTTA